MEYYKLNLNLKLFLFLIKHHPIKADRGLEI
jgi:hypothetical protein